MQIDYAGGSCLSFRTKNLTILTDPPENPGKGMKFDADVILESILTDRVEFSGLLKSGAQPRVFARPGEYEVRGVSMSGIEILPTEDEPNTYHTIFHLQIEDLDVCYLGNLRILPDMDIWEETGTMDVLVTPADGSLPSKAISEMISLLRPKIVIPTQVSSAEEVTAFATLLGLGEPELVPSLKVTNKELGEKTRLVGILAV